eukprot:SAG11_NODE_27102_length_336_cov_24.556962_1_plen_65_part_10
MSVVFIKSAVLVSGYSDTWFVRGVLNFCATRTCGARARSSTRGGFRTCSGPEVAAVLAVSGAWVP